MKAHFKITGLYCEIQGYKFRKHLDIKKKKSSLKSHQLICLLIPLVFCNQLFGCIAKKTEKECTSTARQIDDYIQTLKSINLQLPLSLREEFDIVLFDVLRVKNEIQSFNKEYKFGNTSYLYKGFNYEKLEHSLLKEVENYYVVSIP